MRVLLFIFLSLFGSQALSSESRGELLAKLESCGEVLGPLKRLGCFEQILEEGRIERENEKEKEKKRRLGKSCSSFFSFGSLNYN